jgi:hypothetical protein
MFRAAIAITLIQVVVIPWLAYRARGNRLAPAEANVDRELRMLALDLENRKLTCALDLIATPSRWPRRADTVETLRAIAAQALKAGAPQDV